MAVISVEVPDTLVKDIKPFSIVNYDELEEIMYPKIVDFGKEGVGKEELEKYFAENPQNG